MSTGKEVGSAVRCALLIGALALIVAPTLTFVGWLISHSSVGSFFEFGYGAGLSEGSIELNSSSDPALIFRYFLLPHYFIYASMPFFIGLALTVAYMIGKIHPWHSLIGFVFSTVGAVYFIGVLGAFLSAPVDAEIASTVLTVSFVLSTLLFVGNIILGFGLYKSKIVHKTPAILFIVGNTLFFVFPAKENWMSLASFLMLVGLAPLALKILRQRQYVT